MMDTMNAFDLLILPMTEWTVGTYSAFALIRLFQVAIGRLIGPSGRTPGDDFARGTADLGVYRPASPRAARPRVRALNLSR
jgi:hypothetical protein